MAHHNARLFQTMLPIHAYNYAVSTRSKGMACPNPRHARRNPVSKRLPETTFGALRSMLDAIECKQECRRTNYSFSLTTTPQGCCSLPYMMSPIQPLILAVYWPLSPLTMGMWMS